MWNKIKSLVGSLRFWVVTFGWASDYLAKVAADGFDLTVMFTQLSLWFGTVVGIGTLDSVATKFGATFGKK